MVKRVLRRLKSIASRHFDILSRLVSRQPLTLPSLGSVTLDEDDVEIARNFLVDRSRWDNPEQVAEYEQRFAQWNGSKHAFAFMGGRVALSACIFALDLKPGDEVIVPGYTCVVVPNAFQYDGIVAVYADIELETYGLDAAAFEAKITPRTRAVLLHHLYGLVCRDYAEIIAVAKRHDLYVIEDCAHSTGAEYQGHKIGNRGHVGFYSSEQSKIFTTIQGGIAVTNDHRLSERLKLYAERAAYPDSKRLERILRDVSLNYIQFKHPQRWWRGEWAELTEGGKKIISTTREEERGIRPAYYGQKMPAPLAAIGLNQLKKIDAYNEARRHTAKRWTAWCKKNGYTPPRVIADSVPVFLRYPVLVEAHKKRDLRWAVKELGVRPGVWFVSQVHPIPWRIEGCPNAEKAVRQCINLPVLMNDQAIGDLLSSPS